VLRPPDLPLAAPPLVCPSPCGSYLFRATGLAAPEILDLDARSQSHLGRELAAAADPKAALWTAEADSFICMLTKRGGFDCYHIEG